MWIDDLRAVMPPPVQAVGADLRWEEAEGAIGLPIPQDFKIFVGSYGDGGIGDFIWHFYPEKPGSLIDLASAARRIDAAYSELRTSHPRHFPLPPLPESGSFLPWALTDNGDYLGWIVGNGDPDAWPVAILDDEDGLPEIFDMPLGPFLLGLVRGEIRPGAFPEDLFQPTPLTFVPAGD